MLKFRSFLLEAAAAIGHDSRGKMFELLVAKHLHPEKKLPSHFRNKHNSSPTEVHNFLKSRHPDHHPTIDSHAKSTAAHIKGYLHDQGIVPKEHHISDVSWTSNKTDHHSLTGIHDPHSNADLMLTHHHPKTPDKKSYVGVSLKYGTSKHPNLKGPGIASLEKASGATIGHLHKQGQMKVAQLTGGSNAKEIKQGFKDHERSSNPAKQQKAAAAREHVRQTNNGIAQHIANGLAKHSRTRLVSTIRSLAGAHPNVFPHIRASANPETGHTHVTTPEKDFNTKIKNYKNIRVRPHKGTSNVIHVEGDHYQTGKTKSIVQLALKNVSGAGSGLQAVVKAPGLHD